MSGPEIVSAARRWLGTPYLHQASCRGAGTDCLGLILGIWRERFGALPEAVPGYTPDWSEAAREERLWQAARRHMREKPVAQAAMGDVLLFRMRAGGVAKHMGVQGEVATGAETFIHAYSGRGVVESRLSGPWARRVVARFAFPERI
ncbi:GTA NlpC/P60 family peptidase [Roseibacterium elongatum DSM 19469]|uniref:GTA NlpC/P60 family peptidase n=1 Tax=Roseicyclus elongatus DSM 19469 TaxID=1294273 RepID=W8S731_9RHOB|nr:NlpC/P60 family protein [Roseibacterium elongatum]AHM04751.1 GTA NlpC/P60 family peptidase [Roseibacterium elongatum DSM 19469]